MRDRARAVAVTAARRAGRVVRRGVAGVGRRIPGPFGVLAYHRVAEVSDDPWALSVTPAHFDAHLAVLQALGRIEPLENALAASTSARCRQRRPTFAITFDDGYVDNLANAVGVLELHDAPATIFIATGLLDRPTFWWDVLSALTFGSGVSYAQLLEAAHATGLLAGVERDGAPEDLAAAHLVLYEALIRLPLAEIEGFLEKLSAHAGVVIPTPSGRPLTTEELHRLAAHPLVTIGIHTVSHPRLPLLAPDEVRAEISDGARRLDELLGVRRRVLAYPYGATSATVAGIAGSIGVTDAVTTATRWVGLREDPLLIPRLHPHDLDGDAFADWLAHA